MFCCPSDIWREAKLSIIGEESLSIYVQIDIMASTGNTDRNKCIYEGSESGGMDIRWRIDRWTELKFYASPNSSRDVLYQSTKLWHF